MQLTKYDIKKQKEVNRVKKVIGIVLALSLVVVAASAMAFGPGQGMGLGMGFGGDCGCGIGENLTPEQAKKYTTVQNEILPLRQKMIQLRTELMNLRAQPQTDWKAIADKQKEMVDVRIEIQKKAGKSDVTGYCPGFCGEGRGMRAAKMGRMGI